MKYEDLPLPSPIKLPEGYILERTPMYTGGVSYGIRKYPDTGLITSGTEMGRFTAFPNELNEDELITMSSDMEPELQRKGIGRQIYKQAEKDTGMTIIPDQILSERSSPLHRDHGLGKEFGSSNYEDIIKRGIERKAAEDNAKYAGKVTTEYSPWTGEASARVRPPEWPPEVAQKTYNKIKDKMKSYGLDKFKSVAPAILKGLGVASALTAPSADAAAADILIPGGLEEMGVSEEQKMLDQRYLQRIKSMQQRKK